MPNETTTAGTLSTKASKALDTMRARAVKADEARTDAAEAWDALVAHAATQAGQCRHGAALADRTRHRWAR